MIGAFFIFITIFYFFEPTLYRNLFSPLRGKRMLVGLLGHNGHGKDTVADYLVQYHGFEKDSFASPLKKMLKPMFDFSDQQLYDHKEKEVVDCRWGITPREAMLFVGTEMVRDGNVHQLLPQVKPKGFWVELMKVRLLPLRKKTNVVIADVRCQNEVEMILNMGGVIVKVVRPGFEVQNRNHTTVKEIDEMDPKNILHTLKNEAPLNIFCEKIDRDLVPVLLSQPNR